MNELEQQRQHFENISDKYINLRLDKKHEYLKDKIWNALFSKIFLPSKKSNVNILEAMCGAADSFLISQKYVQSKFCFEAFDYSDSMVQHAQKKFPNITVWTQDVTQFCRDDSYDIIFIIGGLHHVHKHSEQVISNVKKSLVPGGLFLNFEPTHNNKIFRIIREGIYKNNELFDEDTEKAFTTAELNNMAERCGLRRQAQLYPGLLAYILWYNPDAFPLLNKGPLGLAKKYIQLESKLWESRLARYLSFATLSCYQRME